MNRPINLPHLDPLRFAKNVIRFDEEYYALVECIFPDIPTKGMLLEAAAQASAAFEDYVDEPRKGFLASIKEVAYYAALTDKKYLIKIKQINQINQAHEFEFIVTTFNNGKKLATGKLTIVVEEK